MSNRFARLAGIISALLVIAGCAGSSGGGASAAPTSAATAGPSGVPGCTSLPRILPSSCQYVMLPNIDGASIMTGVEFPTGWRWEGGGGGAEGPGGAGAPDGIRFSVFGEGGVFSDPCRWDVDGSGVFFQPGDVQVGPSAADLADALHANAAYTSSAPSQVTVGRLPGFALDIEFDPRIDPGTCDEAAVGGGRYTVFAGAEAGPAVTSGDTRWHLVVIQYGPEYRLIAFLGYFAGTPAADIAAGKKIIESLNIGMGEDF